MTDSSFSHSSESYIPLPSTNPSPTSKPSPENTPSSLANLTIFSFFLLGVGVLLPWNAFLSVLDYYTQLLPTISIAQYITNAYTFPFMLIGIALVFMPTPPPRRISIFSGFGLLTILTALLPIVLHGSKPVSDPFSSAIFWLTVVTVVVIGIISALLQSTLYASLANFPNGHCTIAFTAGGGAASVLIAALRILCRLLMDGSAGGGIEALGRGFEVFFTTCSLLCGLCLGVYMWMENWSVEYRYWISQGEEVTGKVGGGWVESKRVLWEMRWIGGAVLVSMVVTLATFPGIMVQIPIHMRNGIGEGMKSWFPLIVISVFAIGDTIGKGGVGEVFMEKWGRWLVCIAVARVVLMPLYVAIWGGLGSVGWTGIWTLVLGLGILNGGVVTMGFLSVPRVLRPESKEVAGRLMFVMLIVGMWLGNVAGWAIEAALKSTSDF